MPGKPKYTEEILKEICSERGYVFLEIYVKGRKRRIKTLCPNSHLRDCSIDVFLNSECKECQRLTYNEVKRRIESQGYTLLSTEYKSYHDKLLVQCPQGHTYEVQLANFDYGKRCPHCQNVYKGENKIKEVLDSFNIEYKIQYVFKDCKYVQVMPFDFYIPSLNLCIEYDGEQHFKPICFGGSYTKEELQERFQIRKLKDEIKNEYCKTNNIKLLRIPYTEFDNIEHILKNNLF